MINLITASPGVGKTLYATMQLIKQDELNKKNCPIATKNYDLNQQILSKNLDKKITVDLIEFKGNQNLFVEIRAALEQYDQQEITLQDYYACFNHYDFSDFYSPKVTAKHYYLSTTYNLINNFVNKELDLKFNEIPAVRQIYSDINGLRVEDVLQSPDDWRECPDGSVIFYDEVQNRAIYKNTKVKNPIIEELTVHRHRGFDIWFITQFPTLIHVEVRAVVGQHYHLFRPWGLPQAYVHVWSYSVVDPNSFSKKRAAERTFRFSYPKKMFKKYTSSTMHTHKINLPKKLLLYGFGICFGLYMFINGMSKGTIFNKGSDTVATVTDKANAAKDSNPYAQKETTATDQITPELASKIKACEEQFGWTFGQCREAYDKEFLEKGQQQRTVNTVFIYDASHPYSTVTENLNYEVTSKPVFAGCAKFGTKYVAYTQQGTILHDVKKSDCKRLIEENDRPFDYFKQENQNANFNTQVNNTNAVQQNSEQYIQKEVTQANNVVDPKLQAKVINGANAI